MSKNSVSKIYKTLNVREDTRRKLKIEASKRSLKIQELGSDILDKELKKLQNCG